MVTRFPRRPRVPIPPPNRPLGDLLQRLAEIDPVAIHALTMLTRDILRRAEARHLVNFKYRDPTRSALWAVAMLPLLF